MDPEIERLEAEERAAEAAFLEHRLSAFVAFYVDDPSRSIGTGRPVDALRNPEWNARYEELRTAVEATRTAVDTWYRRHGAA